jgi:hypothetical protein
MLTILSANSHAHKIWLPQTSPDKKQYPSTRPKMPRNSQPKQQKTKEMQNAALVRTLVF